MVDPRPTPGTSPPGQPQVQALEAKVEGFRQSGETVALADACMELAGAYAASGWFRRALTT